MGPLFVWDLEEEQTLKALPYVIDWFMKAEVAVADEDISTDDDSILFSDDEGDEDYRIEEKKLSAILQFAKAMPLLFGGIATFSNGA